MSLTSDQQRWVDKERLAALRKWYPLWNAFSGETAQIFVDAIPPGGAWSVLDLASGAGEPALSVASKSVPRGRVTLTDIAAEILSIAEEEARLSGIKNVSFETATLPRLPFPDESFDVVTCRFGVMFFPDAVVALRECRRVLRPGGRAIFMAWCAADQPYFAATIGQLRKYAEIPADSADTPTPFRFAANGLLRAAFEQSGLAACVEETREVALRWPGSVAQLCEFFVATTGYYRPYFESLAADVRVRLMNDVQRALARFAEGSQVICPARVVLAMGTR